MPDSGTMKAEPAMQPTLRLATAALSLLVVVSLLAAHHMFDGLPNRRPLPPAATKIRFEPVELDSAGFLPLRLAGAWRVSSDDARVGAISGIAIDRGRLVAITDSGVAISVAQPPGPAAPAIVRDLPSGPGDARFKRNRDSEAIAADPAGRGWWLAFENRNSLWLYDAAFDRALARIAVPAAFLDWNLGIEGLAVSGPRLLALPESGGRALTLGQHGWAEVRFTFPARRISAAAALSDDSLLVIERRMTLLGFANSVVRLDRCSGGYCLAWRKRLPLGPLDNVEAIAVERLGSGGKRLWLATDDDMRRPMRTLVVAADLPGGP